MSAHNASSPMSFQLPSLSYIDAKWEEPALRIPAPPARVVHKGGLVAWLSRQVAAFRAWRLEQETAFELSTMSDRELLDIGISRADVGRAFTPAFNADLQQRGL